MSARRQTRTRSRLASAAPVFAALGDATRLALIAQLGAAGPMSIARLSAEAPVTRQAVTKHLHVLHDAGLVRSVKRGRERIWEVDVTPLVDARRFLDEVSATWDTALERLRKHLE